MSMFPILIKLIDSTTGDYLFQIPPQKVLDAKFNKRLNDVGILSLTFAYESSLVNYFNLDTFIEVYIYNPFSLSYEKFETYFVRIFREYIENETHYYGIGGVSLNDLLRRRILNPETDSNAANGYVTLGDSAHLVMYELINEHLVNSSATERNFPNLTIQYGETKSILAGIRDRHKQIFELCQTVAKKGEIDFVIERTTSNNLVCTIGVIGLDKTKTTNYPNLPYTVLNPDHRTLLSPSYEIDRSSEKNYIYMLDKQSDEEITAIEYPTSDRFDSNYNRIEFTKTVNSDSDDFEEVLTSAIEELQDNRQKNIFRYRLPNSIKTIELSIGDKVTLYWSGVQKDIRLTEINLTLQGTSFTQEYKVEDVLI